MKSFYGLSPLAVLVLALSCGCNRNHGSPPEPLPEGEIPSAITQAFSTADKETRDQATQYVTDVRNHDKSAAFEDVQQLAQRHGLTRDQRAIVVRALMTSAQQAHEAADNGDTRARQVLSNFRATK
jgi:hypothetical protein